MEKNEAPLRSGNNKSGHKRNPNIMPGHPDEETESNFDSEHDEAEINPEKLEREKIHSDSSGDDNSQGHQPYEFKKQDSTSARNQSGKKNEQGSLMGQGGYGTSGTSGTNSGGQQGYQSGIGSAGSQNGSTGYNSGSLGYKPKFKEIDINKLGKNLH